MRISECAKIAFRNLIVAKKISVKILIGLSAVIMLLFSMGMYRKSFDDQIEEISIQHKSDCYLQEFHDIGDMKVYREKKENIFAHKDSWKIDEVCGLVPVSVHKGKKGKDIDSLADNGEAIRNAKIILDGNEYKGKADWLTDIKPENKIYQTDVVEVNFYDKDFTMFSKNVISQYQEEMGIEKYLMGSLPQQEGEIIISDYLLGKFGIEQAEQEQMIGKKISLYVGTEGNLAYFEDYRLVGIFDADIIDIRERNSVIKSIAQVAVYFREKDYGNIDFLNGGEIRYYEDDFGQLTDAYLLAEQEEEAVDMSAYGMIYSVLDRQMSVINKILECIMAGFVIAVTVYITSIIYFFFQRNRVYFVMLRAIGIRKRCIYQITMFEILYLIMCAMVIGIYFALLVWFALKNVYEYAIGFDFKFTLQSIVISGFISVGYCLVIFFIEGIVHCKNIMKETITEVLKCEKKF